MAGARIEGRAGPRGPWCCSAAVQGHLGPMLQLAGALHARGLAATVLHGLQRARRGSAGARVRRRAVGRRHRARARRSARTHRQDHGAQRRHRGVGAPATRSRR